ncbi:hypothetical protein, PiggyBac, partial [Trachipleistophora hominis]
VCAKRKKKMPNDLAKNGWKYEMRSCHGVVEIEWKDKQDVFIPSIINQIIKQIPKIK